jgi:hypothetical protein
MKKEGLPPIPRFIDVDNEAASSATNQKERISTLLAEPSAEMVAAAEEAEISGRELTRVLWQRAGHRLPSSRNQAEAAGESAFRHVWRAGEIASHQQACSLRGESRKTSDTSCVLRISGIATSDKMR